MPSQSIGIRLVEGGFGTLLRASLVFASIFLPGSHSPFAFVRCRHKTQFGRVCAWWITAHFNVTYTRSAQSNFVLHAARGGGGGGWGPKKCGVRNQHGQRLLAALCKLLVAVAVPARTRPQKGMSTSLCLPTADGQCNCWRKWSGWWAWLQEVGAHDTDAHSMGEQVLSQPSHPWPVCIQSG